VYAPGGDVAEASLTWVNQQRTVIIQRKNGSGICANSVEPSVTDIQDAGRTDC
jgi:hypothetical protein